MKRRNFTQLAGMSGLGLFSAPSVFATEISQNKHSFNLAYAPHLGMLISSILWQIKDLLLLRTMG
jgi:hypothetical protein